MYAQWVYFVLVFVGLLILRYKRPNMRRPFKVIHFIELGSDADTYMVAGFSVVLLFFFIKNSKPISVGSCI